MHEYDRRYPIMARGRTPQPKVINDLKGDPHERRRHEKEPEPPKNRSECPAYLDDIAPADWAYTCDRLDEIGLLSSADRSYIEFNCHSYSRYRKADAMVAKFGEVLVPRKQSPRISRHIRQ